MRDTVIKGERGYLRPYLQKLNPADTQSMVFKETDEGEFWMNKEEQENSRHDKIILGSKQEHLERRS
jgi:hypothetical protein